MTDMTLGQNICRLRTERGLSQGDLADALDISRQSISKWETDASVPELEKLLRLSGLFQVSLDELVKGPAPEAAPKNSPGGPEAPIPPEGKPLQRDDADLLPALDRGVNRILGLVLLGFGALLTILLAVLGGAAGVYGLTMSAAARDYLAARGIPAEWETLAERIINRTGTGLCPMETAVLDIDDPAEGLTALRETMGRLAAGQ